MITEEELLLANDAPLKKDFYQLYPEILDIVSKITERWDPTTSNESDPGVVLLKLLAFVGDKINYNIDKNILECFMPSATQEDSMRKLCDMMGYSMSYYQSAVTPVSVTYLGNEMTGEGDRDHLVIEPFTSVITNEDESLTYVVIGSLDQYGKPDGKRVLISHPGEAVEVIAMEGEYCECYAGQSELIQLFNLDDNRRFYFPEASVAENGIFIKTETDEVGGTDYWTRVDNLNTQRAGQNVFKFGYDSKRFLPYVQFPEDIASLIKNGLRIHYIRTRGIGGNVKALALSKFTSSIYWNNGDTLDDADTTLNVVNLYAATNGQNAETLDDAYNNFKKTVGTFDTLVTCRDYANKIYQLVSGEGNPYVSNIQVSDIRDDLNKSYSIGTFSNYGTAFVNKSKTHSPDNEEVVEDIKPYDLCLYMFKPITGAYTKDSYRKSFEYSEDNESFIREDLEDYKTIAHHFIEPNPEDIVAVKNYLTINAKITTTHKVNSSEEKNILTHIKEALYRDFNMRKVDWGEPVSIDTIRETIKGADSSIKQVDLDESDIDTRFLTGDNKEYNSKSSSYESLYVGLVMKNVLAGRVPLFEYFDTFEPAYGEQNVLGESLSGQDVAAVETHFNPPTNSYTSNQKPLNANEVIQFSAPSYNTYLTYPAYINYYWDGEYIGKNNNHQLKDGESLYINYTDTNKNEWNLKYYNEGLHGKVCKNGLEPEILDHLIIIHPNFDLQRSSTRYAEMITGQKHKYDWAKTDGYRFSNPIPGMYSLGANETLEFKAPVEIKFDKTLYCAWSVNDPDNKIANRFDLIDGKWRFTLETGEYFYYTSSSKTDLGILGSGTRLIIDVDPVENKIFPDIESKTDSEEVSSLGLNASFNWSSINFSKHPLIAQEREYITLAEGDVLNSLALVEESGEPYPSHLSNVPAKVLSATYNSNSEGLPTLPGEDNYWEVISRLDLNIGPNTSQTLYSSYDSVTFFRWNGTKYELFETVTGNDSTDPTEQVTLKSSALVQRAGGTSFLFNPLHEEGEDLKFKEFNKKPSMTFDDNSRDLKPESGGTVLPIEAVGYTKVSFSEEDTNPVSLIKLPVFTPESDDYFGLVMVYFTPSNPEAKLIAWATSDGLESGDVEDPISLYSYTSGDASEGAAVDLTFEEGESGGTDTHKGLVLQRGISIIKLNKGCSCLYLDNRTGWKKDNTEIERDTNSSVTIGLPSIVDRKSNSEGVNTSLLGIDDGEVNVLLYNIRKAATVTNSYPSGGESADITQNIFYYNMPIDGSTLIEINTNADESLRSASSWYDYNNTVNKFVITELDADTFDTHIQLTKASKQ